MRLISALVVLLYVSSILSGQSIVDLYNSENYTDLIKIDISIDSMTSEDCYMKGYAYYRLEDDASAIDYYNAAIEKGYDNSDVYFYRGLSYRYIDELDKSLVDLQKSVETSPDRQRNLFELGNAYLYLENIEEASSTFKIAREKDYELGGPYYYYPYIYQYQEEYNKALQEYKISASMIDKSDPQYIDILMEIGVLEYSLSKNYEAAKSTYEEVISIVDEATGYMVYSKLIKCYSGLEEYSKADSLYREMKKAYDNKQLPAELMEEGLVAIDEFNWNDRKVISFKSLVTPEETLDELYKAYLLNEQEDGTEIKFMTEKTIAFEDDSPNHLFCSRGKDETHYTYPVGWSSADIDYVEFKQFVIEVLNEKIKPSASSSFKR